MNPPVTTQVLAMADSDGWATSMQRIFPGNRNIRPKIRQQLQVLRDMGILVHVGRGEWMLPDHTISSPPQSN